MLAGLLSDEVFLYFTGEELAFSSPHEDINLIMEDLLHIITIVLSLSLLNDTGI